MMDSENLDLVRTLLAWVTEIHEGKLALLHSYENPADALKAVGLEE
jgi:hypothetical protein